jgi:DNA-binding transcriptional ArsR family regulator
MQPSAVSHALRLLRAHNVVGSRREGKLVVYFLRSSDVAAVLDRFVP